MELIFTDREVQNVLNLFKVRSFEGDRSDTLSYTAAKAVRDAVENNLKEKSLEELLREVVEWQKETFPQATSASRAEHLYREAKELRDNPSDTEEMADVLFLLAGLAAGEGIALVEVCRRKLEINKAREWGKPDSQGVVEHVRKQLPVDVDGYVIAPVVFDLDYGTPTVLRVRYIKED